MTETLLELGQGGALLCIKGLDPFSSTIYTRGDLQIVRIIIYNKKILIQQTIILILYLIYTRGG